MGWREDAEALGLSTRAYLTCLRAMWPKTSFTLDELCHELEKGFPVRGIGEKGVAELERVTGYKLQYIGRQELDKFDIGFKVPYRILRRVDEYVQKPKRKRSMTWFMCEWLAENMEAPCNFSNDEGDYVDIIDPNHDYCETHCGQPVGECWRRLFVNLREAQNDE